MFVPVINCDTNLANNVEIKGSLRDYQTIVGGYVETVRLPNDLIMLINEEGKIEGLPRNYLATRLCCKYGVLFPGDYIVGNAVLVRLNAAGDDWEGFGSEVECESALSSLLE